MAVSEEYEGRSIGKALTITGLNYLKYQGLTSAMLYVDEENKKAVNLYKSLGFVESGKDVMYKLKS
jgi:mycothiol synthase